MKKFDHQVYLVRQRTKTDDWDETAGNVHGIPQSVFVELGNYAQDHLQTIIRNVYSQLFITSVEISCVNGTETYSVPDRVLLNGGIIRVEFSQNGQSEYYAPLKRAGLLERSGRKGTPSRYIVQDGAILLNYIPQSTSGKIRVTFIRELDDLDIERGRVNGTPSGSTISVTSGDEASLPLNLANSTHICISNKRGVVVLRNAEIATWSTPTLTVVGDVADYLVSGYTLSDLAGGSITIGEYTTTHSKLPDGCERYIMLYMQKRVLTIDESNTSVEEDMELKTIEAEIMKSFSDEVRDPAEIPVLDWEIMS